MSVVSTQITYPRAYNSELTNTELRDIAKLHLVSFGDDILSQLGLNVIYRFYHSLYQQSKDCFLVVRAQEKIIGFCLLSFDVESIFRRFAFSQFPVHLLMIGLKAISSLFLFIFLLKYFGKKPVTSEKYLNPEIGYIFVAPEAQGHGTGKQLIQQCQNVCRKLNCNTLYTKTREQDNEATIHFYQKNGFKIRDHFMRGDHSYLHLELRVIE